MNRSTVKINTDLADLENAEKINPFLTLLMERYETGQASIGSDPGSAIRAGGNSGGPHAGQPVDIDVAD